MNEIIYGRAAQEILEAIVENGLPLGWGPIPKECLSSREALMELWLAPNSVLAQDLEGKLVYANRKALSFFGYNQDEFIGMPSLNLVPDKPGVKEKRTKIIKEILATGDVKNFYGTERIQKGGKPIQVPHWAGYRYKLGESYSFGAILFHNSTRK